MEPQLLFSVSLKRPTLSASPKNPQMIYSKASMETGTLLIETSTEKACIAFLNEKKLIMRELPGNKELSDVLAHEIHNLLKTNNLNPFQIAVGEGPGSYTGTRVGVSMAQALAYGFKIPLIKFCSLKAFFPKDETEDFAIVFDARLSGIHAFFKNEKKPILLNPSELKQRLQEPLLLLSPHPELIEKRLERPCKKAHLQISMSLFEAKDA